MSKNRRGQVLGQTLSTRATAQATRLHAINDAKTHEKQEFLALSNRAD
jgi:hypothetical protein